ncbi:MAG TPA: YbaK/EbsC family protein [Ktedonobacterales bacterium]|nr:YbaK/EbsC family protein [Ktedonobacterales bacterium]
MKASVARVVEALQGAGLDVEIKEFAESTRTAEEAASAVGSTVGQIVKSLVFLAGEDPILALVSGDNRADTAKLAHIAGATIRRADADVVRRATGFSIGGVPPLGHTSPLPTYLDRDLMRYAVVWAAAGTPNAVFAIAPHDLKRVASASVVDLAVETA